MTLKKKGLEILFQLNSLMQRKAILHAETRREAMGVLLRGLSKVDPSFSIGDFIPKPLAEKSYPQNLTQALFIG